VYSKSFLTVLSIAFITLLSSAHLAYAQVPDTQARDADGEPSAPSRFVQDLKAYVTAPAHWDRGDWLFFGGTLAATGIARHFDSQVRTHFTTGQYASNLTNPSTNEGRDAIPALVVMGATWAYAAWSDDTAGRREVGAMAEAAVLSTGSGFVLRRILGRERPSETDDPGKWFTASSSFPSLHSTAAFAIGTVLAESGNDEYRWVRRTLGYGLGVYTAYERLRYNDHWLSDTVAGAGLGIATAQFVMHRRASPQSGSLQVLPVPGGAMLAYTMIR
jgi:membrane-associated phospholipid phosphatase